MILKKFASGCSHGQETHNPIHETQHVCHTSTEIFTFSKLWLQNVQNTTSECECFWMSASVWQRGFVTRPTNYSLFRSHNFNMLKQIWGISKQHDSCFCQMSNEILTLSKSWFEKKTQIEHNRFRNFSCAQPPAVIISSAWSSWSDLSLGWPLLYFSRCVRPCNAIKHHGHFPKIRCR